MARDLHPNRMNRLRPQFHSASEASDYLANFGGLEDSGRRKHNLSQVQTLAQINEQLAGRGSSESLSYQSEENPVFDDIIQKDTISKEMLAYRHRKPYINEC